MIDDIDKQILTILQVNGRISNADIARNIGMAPSGVLERIRKLEDKGIIRQYFTDIDARSLDLNVLAYIFVKANKQMTDTATALAKIPAVLEVHHICGEDCYLVKVRSADTESLGRLLQEDINGISSVSSTKTTIVLNTIKESHVLPIQRELGETSLAV